MPDFYLHCEVQNQQPGVFRQGRNPPDHFSSLRSVRIISALLNTRSSRAGPPGNDPVFSIFLPMLSKIPSPLFYPAPDTGQKGKILRDSLNTLIRQFCGAGIFLFFEKTGEISGSAIKTGSMVYSEIRKPVTPHKYSISGINAWTGQDAREVFF